MYRTLLTTNSTTAFANASLSENVRNRTESQRESINSRTNTFAARCSSVVNLNDGDCNFDAIRDSLASKFGVPTNISISNRPGRVTAASNDRNLWTNVVFALFA